MQFGATIGPILRYLETILNQKLLGSWGSAD